MVWEIKTECEIDINNPLKSIREICDNIGELMAKDRRDEYSIDIDYYPRTVYLESSNGEIKVEISLDKLLKECEVVYKVDIDNIRENKIYEIIKKYGTNPPNASYIRTFLRVKQCTSNKIIYYQIKRLEDTLMIEAQPSIERYKELYNSLRDALKRFRIDETKIEKIVADIKNEGKAEINLPENIPAEEYINIYTNIYLENVRKGFTVISSNEWKVSKDGGKILLCYNPKGYHIIEIGIYLPTEEKIRQLLIDMKNIGQEDTKINEDI